MSHAEPPEPTGEPVPPVDAHQPARLGAIEEEWRRFHPLSPIIRGGLIALAIVGSMVSQQVDRLFGGGDPERYGRAIWLTVGGGALALIAATVLVSWISWRFSRFRLTPTLVEVRSGVLFRQHRQVRYDRIQAVDVTRPILARVFGLSEVVVQSAGGRQGQVKLAFLTQADAAVLRDRLADLSLQHDAVLHDPLDAAGQSSPRAANDGGDARLGQRGTGAAPAAGLRTVVRVPSARLIHAWALSPQFVLSLIAAGVVLFGLIAGHGALVATAAPVLFGLGGHKIRQLVTELNFELDHGPAALRTRHGLTELRATTTPLHRIQAVQLTQPLWWRPFGWWRVVCNVAGGGQSDEVIPQNVLLPVGTIPEALTVLELAAPGIPEETAHRAAAGRGPDGGFVTAPPAARRFDPWSWQRLGYAVTPDHLLARSGRFTRVVQVVPHARVQSLAMEQGPLQRRAAVASVRLISTVGEVSPRVDHLAVDDAEALVQTQMARSTAARGRGSADTR